MSEDLILFCLIVFSISSIWLYSPGPDKVRTWWVNNTGFLAPLAYCQMCCSFWIAIFSYAILYDVYTIYSVIAYCLIASVVSWALGSAINAFLWIRAVCELEVRRIGKDASN